MRLLLKKKSARSVGSSLATRWRTAMARCEECSAALDTGLLQCPRCLARQSHQALYGEPPHDPYAVGSAVDPAEVKVPAQSGHSVWAQRKLSSFGHLWDGEINRKMTLAAETYAKQLHPPDDVRWFWHAGSTALFLVSASLGAQFSGGPGVFLSLFWLVSVGLHAYIAVVRRGKRLQARQRTQLLLTAELKKALAEARPSSSHRGPFGLSQSHPPSPELHGVDARDAEYLCATWLAYLGEEHVKVTRATGDGGVDITSARCVAQVKNYHGSVGVMPVRELVGVASVDGRFPVFFTSGTYTKAAVEFADQANVYLFKYDAREGTLDAKSAVARAALAAN